MIELRDWQVLALPPFAAAIVRIPHAAIVTAEDRLRIRRIDPNIVHVAVRSLKPPYHCKTPACILAQNQCAIGLEHAIRIFWIDYQVREVERSPHHPIALIPRSPGHAAIVGDEQCALTRSEEH